MAEDDTGKQDKTDTQVDAKGTKSPPKLKSAKKATVKKKTTKKKVVKKTVVKKRSPTKKRTAVGASKQAPDLTAATVAAADRQESQSVTSTATSQATAVPAAATNQPHPDTAARSATTGSDSEESRRMTTKTSQPGSKAAVGFWPIVLIWIVIVLAGFMYIRSLAHKEALQSQTDQAVGQQVTVGAVDETAAATDTASSDAQVSTADAVEAVISDPPADLSSEMTIGEPGVQAPQSAEQSESMNLAPGSLQSGVFGEVTVDKPEPVAKTTDAPQEASQGATGTTPATAGVEAATAPTTPPPTPPEEKTAIPPSAASPEPPVSTESAKATQPPQSPSAPMEAAASAESSPTVKEPAVGTATTDQPADAPAPTATPGSSVDRSHQSLRERFGYTRPTPGSRFSRQRYHQPPVAATERAAQPEEGSSSSSTPQQSLRFRPRFQPGYGYPYARPGYGYPGYGPYYPWMIAPQRPAATPER